MMARDSKLDALLAPLAQPLAQGLQRVALGRRHTRGLSRRSMTASSRSATPLPASSARSPRPSASGMMATPGSWLKTSLLTMISARRCGSCTSSASATGLRCAAAGLLVQLHDGPGRIGVQRLQPGQDIVGEREGDELGGSPDTWGAGPAARARRSVFIHKNECSQSSLEENIPEENRSAVRKPREDPETRKARRLRTKLQSPSCLSASSCLRGVVVAR